MSTRQDGEAGGASVCSSIHINLFKSQTTLLDKLKKHNLMKILILNS
jgi:hypothetical protein